MDALASGSTATVRSARRLVPGRLMTSYVLQLEVQGEAWDESGVGVATGTVTRTSGGYQICFQQQGTPTCQSFSGFTSDSAGRITGMSVDGQPVAGRLAAAPGASGSGLVLSAVTAYFHAGTGQVGVAFRIRNASSRTVASLGFQLVLVTPGGTRLSMDYQSSDTSPTASQVLPAGQSVSVEAAFDTSVVAGTFAVETNGGYRTLVSCRLRKVR